jgi:hypothetical protein
MAPVLAQPLSASKARAGRRAVSRVFIVGDKKVGYT